jgi:hypothetical protein
MQELRLAVTHALLTVNVRYVSQVFLARSVLDKAVNEAEHTLSV